MNIGVEKLDMHKGVTVKVLLDSGATGMFMDKRMVARHEFKLQKLERPIAVKNVDGMNNSRGAITYQVEVNMYYKGHIKRMRMDVCDLGKTEEMPWLAAHNSSVTLYKTLGKLSDILHLNNRNNQLEKQAWPPRNVPLDT